MNHTTSYFPPPESEGGWRLPTDEDDARAKAGVSEAKLQPVFEAQNLLFGGDSWGLAVVRNGYLVGEYYTFNVLVPTRFDVWSCTKSFTSIAWGLLLDDARNGKTGVAVDLDSPIYEHIPEGHPLTDSSKERILVRHLLSLSSGIKGENFGIAGIPTAQDVGPFEHALGFAPNRFGKWTNELAGEPGEVWDYSDPGMAHLALAFAHIAGYEMDSILQERVFTRIGVAQASWDVQGGSGFLGPHTNAHTGLHLSARAFARVGYMMLRGGRWGDTQVVPSWWVDIATKPSQGLNPNYGYNWWLNTDRRQWPALPEDAFAASGYRMNKCYVIPSLDLVIVRVGSGPVGWNENAFLNGVVDALSA